MTSSIPRSSRAEVRNPVLALPAFKAIHNLPEPVKLALSDLLDNLSKDAEAKAQTSWLKKKGPMAVYWKCVAVYSKHVSRAIKRSCRSDFSLTISQSFEASNENENASTRAA